MNRRDMIIVATLINAGLLVAVFVSAVKPKQAKKALEMANSAHLEKEVEKLKTPLEQVPTNQVADEDHPKTSQKKSPKEDQFLPLAVLDA